MTDRIDYPSILKFGTLSCPWYVECLTLSYVQAELILNLTLICFPIIKEVGVPAVVLLKACQWH